MLRPTPQRGQLHGGTGIYLDEELKSRKRDTSLSPTRRGLSQTDSARNAQRVEAGKSADTSFSTGRKENTPQVSIYMCVCMYVCMYVCMKVSTGVRVYVLICMYVCVVRTCLPSSSSPLLPLLCCPCPLRLYTPPSPAPAVAWWNPRRRETQGKGTLAIFQRTDCRY